jgi:hypothetical protein
MDRNHIFNLPVRFYLNDLSKFNVQNLIKLTIANSLGKIISMIDILVCLITFNFQYAIFWSEYLTYRPSEIW